MSAQTKLKLKARPGRANDVVVPDKLYFRIGEVKNLSTEILREAFRKTVCENARN